MKGLSKMITEQGRFRAILSGDVLVVRTDRKDGPLFVSIKSRDHGNPTLYWPNGKGGKGEKERLVAMDTALAIYLSAIEAATGLVVKLTHLDGQEVGEDLYAGSVLDPREKRYLFVPST